MNKFLTFYLSLFVIASCRPDLSRTEPSGVVIRDVIEKTNEYIVERRMYYILDSVVIDTIQRSNQSSLHTPESYLNNVPDDAVDLNKIFSPKQDKTVDYNYIKLDYNQQQYLNYLDVWWDEYSGYWRQRK
jgi:hypothetical protein